MRWSLTLFLLAWGLSPLPAKDPANPLSPEQLRDGTILLFDGESDFGWTHTGAVEVKGGILTATGPQVLTSTTPFDAFEVFVTYRRTGGEASRLEVQPLDAKAEPTSFLMPTSTGDGWEKVRMTVTAGQIETQHNGGFTHQAKRPAGPLRVQLRMRDGGKLLIKSITLTPLERRSLFNGKDLDGWRVFPGEKYRSVYGVTPEGWLNVRNGPGDLQTRQPFDHFTLQLECISNGPALNSGVFFRCIPDEYQNGYEMQIQNGFKDGDRAKPTDAGTGAIYRRQAARRVIPSDREWFSMTLSAQGNHFATWVNGIQVTDWTDERPADANPRKGLRLERGHLSIQGHDPTTDLSFRRLFIATAGGGK